MYSGRRPKPEFWVANSQPAARLIRTMALCHQVCHKLCQRLTPGCADTGFFDTETECFRAGLVMGKSLKKMVSAEGIESAKKRILNNIQSDR